MLGEYAVEDSEGVLYALKCRCGCLMQIRFGIMKYDFLKVLLDLIYIFYKHSVAVCALYMVYRLHDYYDFNWNRPGLIFHIDM
jgi:hypothetical protein